MPSYKLSVLAAMNLSDRTVCDTLKITGLSEVAKVFVDNMDRVMSMCVFSVRLLNLSSHFLRRWTMARNKILIDDVDEQQYLEKRPQILDECEPFTTQSLTALEGYGEDIQRRWEEGLFLLDAMVSKSGDFLSNAVESTLSSMVVGTWTAFETLAGDLWENALNIHPQGLADLKGSKRGKQQGDGGQKPPSKGDEDRPPDADIGGLRSITVKKLQQYEYNVRAVMGTLLREKVHFTTLQEIREAYSLAFWEKAGTVKEALGNTALDSVAVVRNVIVHKAGVCDSEYRRRVKGLPMLPPLQSGQPLRLDGELVRKLLEPTWGCCVQLIQAVDDWLDSHPERERR